MTMKQIGFRLKPSREAEALGRITQSLGQEGTAQTLSRPRLRGAGLGSPRRGRGPLCAVGQASLKRDGWKPLPFAWSFLFASSIQVPRFCQDASPCRLCRRQACQTFPDLGQSSTSLPLNLPTSGSLVGSLDATRPWAGVRTGKHTHCHIDSDIETRNPKTKPCLNPELLQLNP